MLRVMFFSMISGLWAALLFLMYVMRSVDNTRVEERKKLERKAREDHRREVVKEFLVRKEELEAQREQEREEAKEEARRKMVAERFISE